MQIDGKNSLAKRDRRLVHDGPGLGREVSPTIGTTVWHVVVARLMGADASAMWAGAPYPSLLTPEIQGFRSDLSIRPCKPLSLTEDRLHRSIPMQTIPYFTVLHVGVFGPAVQLYTPHNRLAVSEQLEFRNAFWFIGGVSQCHCRQFRQRGP